MLQRMISSLVWHQVCFSEGNYRRMPQIPWLHLGSILVFYLGTMETCLVSRQGFLNFSNSRKRKHHTVNKIDPQPASYTDKSNMAARANSHLVNYSTECWVNLREIGVCEVSVKQHDLETFPRRSCVLLVLERQTQMRRKFGETTPGYCSGKLNGFYLYWLLSFRCFSSATFRLIPFANSPGSLGRWGLVAKSLAFFDPAQAQLFLCSFLALWILSRNWLSICCCWTKPNVKQNIGTPNEEIFLNVRDGNAVEDSEGSGKGGASLEPDWIMLWWAFVIVPSCQHPC